MLPTQIEIKLIDVLPDGPLSSYPSQSMAFPAAVRAQLDSLASEIQVRGNTRAVVLLKKDNGRFDLSSGEGRFFAHQILGKKTIISVVAN